MSSNAWKGVLVVVVVVLGLWYFGGKSTTDASAIKIGFIAPLSGDAAVYGEPARNMVAMAIGEINAAGGINGRQIEVVYEDGKCSGPYAASAAQKLVNVDKVQVIIGGFCSGESLASVPVAEQGKVALFSPGSSSPDLTGKSPYFVRNYPSDSAQGSVLAEAAYAKGWKKVAFLQEQTDYALGVQKAFSEKFTSLGGTVVKEEFPTPTSDFRSMLAKLKSQNPDALFIDSQTPAVFEKILKQLQDSKWKVALIGNDVLAGMPDLLTRNAALLEGALTAEFGINPANPKFAKMLADYKTKYAIELPYQSYAQTEYDAVYMVRDAILAVGYDGTKIVQWLREVKDWQGASGSITMQANGDRASAHSLEVIRGGKVEQVK